LILEDPAHKSAKQLTGLTPIYFIFYSFPGTVLSISSKKIEIRVYQSFFLIVVANPDPML